MYIIDKEIITKSIYEVMGGMNKYPIIESIMFCKNPDDKIKTCKEISNALEVYVSKTVIFNSEKELMIAAIKHIISDELEEAMYDTIISSCKKEFIIKVYLNFIINSKLKCIETEMNDMKKFIINRLSE